MKQVLVVLGSLRQYLDIDHIEPMIQTAVEFLGAKINLLRVIPEGAPPLKFWAERQEQEGAPVRIYASKHWGGPVSRNNLAITGKDSRKGRTAKEGKAHTVIILGPIPPHYVTTEEGTDKVTHHASTQESLLHHWLTQQVKPRFVQVMCDGKDGFKVCEGKGGKWYHIDPEKEKATLRAPAPPPRKGGDKATLKARSEGFWNATR